MTNFFKISGFIVSMLFTFFLFIMIIRFDKTADNPSETSFISTRAIATKIEGYDVMKPLTDLADKWKTADTLQNDLLDEAYERFQMITWVEPQYKKINNPSDVFSNIGSWFVALGNSISQLFFAIQGIFDVLKYFFINVIIAPIEFLIAVIQWIGYIFYCFFDFIGFILIA